MFHLIGLGGRFMLFGDLFQLFSQRIQRSFTGVAALSDRRQIFHVFLFYVLHGLSMFGGGRVQELFVFLQLRVKLGCVFLFFGVPCLSFFFDGTFLRHTALFQF